MVKLIYFELYKIFHKRTVWFFLILCLAINIISLNYRLTASVEGTYNLYELSELYGKLGASERGAAFLGERMYAVSQEMWSSNGELDQTKMKEYLMMQHIYEKAQSLETYDEYLENMEEEAEIRLNSSMFAMPDTFPYRNLQITPKAYRWLGEVKLVNDFEDGVLLAVQNRLADVFLLVTVLLFMLQLFVAEREEGHLCLIRSMKRGHAELVTAKFIAAAILVALLVLIFYGTNYVLLSQTIGFGDTSRAIQSLTGYDTGTFPISVGQYLFLAIPMKALCLFGICCLFALLCMIVKNSILSSVCMAILFACEVGIWYMVPSGSLLAVLKGLNFAPLFLVDTIFAGYVNYNFFTWPISNFLGAIVSLALCVFVGIGGTYYLHGHDSALARVKRTERKKRKNMERESGLEDNKRSNDKKQRKHVRGVWFFEIYKQAVLGKGVLLLLLFLGAQIILYQGNYYFLSSGEHYYQQYSERLAGSPMVSKAQYLAEENQAFEKIQKEREEIEQRYANQEIDDFKKEFLLNNLRLDQAKYSAYQRAVIRYEGVCGLNENGVGAEYIYDTPWEMLLGTGAQKEYAIHLELALFVLVLMICSSGALEQSSSMDKLIAVSVVGKRGVHGRKVFLYLVDALFVFTVSYLPGIWKVVRVFGMSGENAPISSYFLKSVPFGSLSLGMLFGLELLLFLAIILIVTVLTYVISEKTGNRILTLLICTALFLMPVLVVVLS